MPVFNIKIAVENSKSQLLWMRPQYTTPCTDTIAWNRHGKKQKSDQKKSHGRFLVCTLYFNTALIGW